MKTVSRIFTVLFAVVITSTISMGMGYPQDMFAEHVTNKQVTKNVPPKKVSKGSQKAACSQSAQGVNLKCTMPCKSIPKKNKDNRQATTQLVPMAIVPTCRKVCIIAVKIFKLDGNDVEEQVLPLDEFLNEGFMS